jgi:hypothetical protein
MSAIDSHIAEHALGECVRDGASDGAPSASCVYDATRASVPCEAQLPRSTHQTAGAQMRADLSKGHEVVRAASRTMDHVRRYGEARRVHLDAEQCCSGKNEGGNEALANLPASFACAAAMSQARRATVSHCTK